VVARPVGPFKDGPDYNYQRIKCNVDLLRVIQIGLTFMDPNGRLPTQDGHPYNTWQFNFRFDLNFDLYAADSVQFLQGCGIDFERHNQEGIDATLFGELLMSSGIVLSDEVRWIAFQGKYDFGYFIKILTCDQLPPTQEQFFDLLHTYFPNIYDIKWLLHNVHHELEDKVNAQAGKSDQSPLTADASAGGLPRGQKDKGLEDLAKTLEIPRVGTAHQAGSDSLLTAEVFFRLVNRHLPHVLSAPGGSDTTATSGPGSPLKSPNQPRHHSEPAGSRGRSASVGSDGLIIEGRPCHLRNVLHGLGRGYIQPDRDHSQLSAAAQSRAALAGSPPPGVGISFPRHSPFSPMPPQISAGRQAVAPPPLSGAIRFDGPAPTTIVQE